MSDYLTLVELLAIHDHLINEFGGAAGVRDGGALEAALFRPQTGYYRDVIEEAAALFESLVQNHPFVDGNKRTAFAATDVFLRHNGYLLQVEDADAHRFIVGSLERRELDRDRIDAWLREHTASRSGIETTGLGEGLQPTGGVPGQQDALSVQTVVLMVRTGHALAILPAGEQLDLDRVRTALASQHVDLASPEGVAEAFPELTSGSLPPAEALQGTPILLDERVAEYEYLGFQLADESIRVEGRDLFARTQVRVADICQR